MAAVSLERCPHCNVARPHLTECHVVNPLTGTRPETGDFRWRAFQCTFCDSLVTAKEHKGGVRPTAPEIFPEPQSIPTSIGDPARGYLEQAIRIVEQAPDAAAMMASSSIDAMLKDKGYGGRESFHNRIDKAVNNGLLTKEMGRWAHQVRLVSNDPRHADEDKPHVDKEEAEVMVMFAEALGDILYELPARALRAIRKRPIAC